MTLTSLKNERGGSFTPTTSSRIASPPPPPFFRLPPPLLPQPRRRRQRRLPLRQSVMSARPLQLPVSSLSPPPLPTPTPFTPYLLPFPFLTVGLREKGPLVEKGGGGKRGGSALEQEEEWLGCWCGELVEGERERERTERREVSTSRRLLFFPLGSPSLC